MAGPSCPDCQHMGTPVRNRLVLSRVREVELVLLSSACRSMTFHIFQAPAVTSLLPTAIYGLPKVCYPVGTLPHRIKRTFLKFKACSKSMADKIATPGAIGVDNCSQPHTLSEDAVSPTSHEDERSYASPADEDSIEIHPRISTATQMLKPAANPTSLVDTGVPSTAIDFNFDPVKDDMSVDHNRHFSGLQVLYCLILSCLSCYQNSFQWELRIRWYPTGTLWYLGSLESDSDSFHLAPCNSGFCQNYNFIVERRLNLTHFRLTVCPAHSWLVMLILAAESDARYESEC